MSLPERLEQSSERLREELHWGRAVKELGESRDTE